jgi:tetraacyldisaccharide 4'-kinase
LADASSNAEILGDEPFQFYTKFKNIQVAVDADRKNGIQQLLSQTQKPEVILLDDAYQHRKVKLVLYFTHFLWRAVLMILCYPLGT